MLRSRRFSAGASFFKCATSKIQFFFIGYGFYAPCKASVYRCCANTVYPNRVQTASVNDNIECIDLCMFFLPLLLTTGRPVVMIEKTVSEEDPNGGHDSGCRS